MRHSLLIRAVLFLMAFLCTYGVAHSQEAPVLSAVSSFEGNKTENTDDALPRHFDDKTALAFSQAAIGRQLGDYDLLDREGNAVKFTEYRGKPLIISMIYSSCFHTCPVITQYLARAVKLARSAVGEDGFNVVSIGFDVRHDRPETMKTFARQRGVSRDPYWEFISAADATVIQQLSDNLGFIFTKTQTGFDHLAQITVVDAEGKIYRQVYGENFNLLAVDNFANEDKLTTFLQHTQDLPSAAITYEGQPTKGFRFMGQRFTIDASIFQRLLYREVGDKTKSCVDFDMTQTGCLQGARCLPKALDIPSAMGSEEAENILKEEYENKILVSFYKKQNEFRNLLVSKRVIN